MTTAAPSTAVWTLPNAISFARLALLLPLGVWLVLASSWWWALLVLAVLSVSDWADGFLARRLGQVTVLGQQLDPVADRIAIVAVTFALTLAGVLPWPVVAVIAAVDLTLLVLAALWFRGSPDLPVTRIGKWRTAALLAAIPVLIVAAATEVALVRVLGLTLVWLGALGHVLAGVGYARGMVAKRRAARD